MWRIRDSLSWLLSRLHYPQSMLQEPPATFPPQVSALELAIRAPKVEECRVKKVFFAMSVAALTGACGLTGDGFAVPALAVVSPNYEHGYGYYTPVGPSIYYRPHFGHHVASYHRHHSHGRWRAHA
jgi:hypothetical protein